MANPKGPQKPKNPYQVVILPVAVSPAELDVKALVTKDGKEEQGIQVVFFREKVPEIGIAKTDAAGEAPWKFKLPSGTLIANVGAEALVPGGSVSREAAIPIQSAAKKDDRVIADFQVEDTPLGEGKYRLTFTIADDKGKGIAAKIAFSPSKDFKLDGQDIKHDAPKPEEFDIPENGMRPFIADVAVPKLEVDVFIVGFATKFRKQLTLRGPKPKVNHGPKPSAKDGFFANLFWGLEK